LGFTFPHSVSGLLTALNSVDLPEPFVITDELAAWAGTERVDWCEVREAAPR
jgi:hypothetical protein